MADPKLSSSEGKYSSVDIAWNALHVSVPSKSDGKIVDILKGVSGYAKRGCVTSIMGPSGAGKTTMMDLLAGRLSNASKWSISGEVLVNDEPVDFAAFRRANAYVQQQDDLPPTETVRECLMFSAQLRLPGHLTQAERRERVDAILGELSLQDCANTLVGSASAGIKGISGGEKRRTSVGMELVTSPTCVFLDEPTSGLDSEIAVTIMRTLRTLAVHGRTVALTIHQPNSDITEMFDDFVLMARGQVMYAGPWTDAVQTFASAGYQCPQYKNPTDYFMKIACEEEGIQAMVATQRARWQSTKRAAFTAAPADDGDGGGGGMQGVQVQGGGHVSGGDLTVMDSPEAAPTSFLKQLLVLCGRQLRAWRRHPMMLMGEGVQYIFLALFIGGMYFDVSDSVERGVFQRASSGFFYIVCIAFVPPFTIITVWQDDRKLVRKEVNQNVYSLDVAFWAKTAVTFPIELLFSLLGSVITYFMFGYQTDAGKFFIFWVAVALTLLTAESLGMLMAMVTPSGDIAIVLASIVFILLLALTGFLTTDTPDYYSWIEYINFVRYGNALVFINEMTGLTLFSVNDAGERQAVAGETLLSSQNLDNGLSVGENIAVLVGILVALRIFALLGLKLAHRRGWL